MCCRRYFDYLKSADVFSRSLRSLEAMNLLILEHSVPRNYFRILFVELGGGVHFSEPVKGICHLSAVRRQIGRKTAVF